MDQQVTWVSANAFIEQQTRDIEREFKCSRPRPRSRAMGFSGAEKVQRRRANKCPKCGKRIVDPFSLKIEHDILTCVE